MRTFIKYSGNKSRHLRHILPHIPQQYSSYIEPFVGSGALFLKLQPKKWIINDINQDLMNLWSAIRDNVEHLIKGLKTFSSRNNFTSIDSKEKLVICKTYAKKLPGLDFGPMRALYYLISKSCSYMGHIYVNGQFKIVSLDLKMSINPSYVYFLSDRYYKLLRETSIYLNENTGVVSNNDYKTILKKSKRGDFCFLDVPYMEDKKYLFEYNINEDVNKFINEVYKEVKKLDKRGVKWMMTQSDTPTVYKKYKEYNIVKFPVYRYSSKEYKNELIIKNY